MISITRLIQTLVGEWVVFDERGDLVDADVPTSTGEATLLVSPLTDAVKRIVDGAVHSLDRDQMWVVEAVVLNRVVLDRLDHETMSIEDLLHAVSGLGYSWQVSPVVDL